ncbi:MAG TPA: helix-turn-helix transcriptional regulator [Candidatus Onthousia faecipullorum]|uniref:Helix-turn-helix transcriptional regulator n=1 Tax=Candidatus Onthousia faecipullorum TaxID=2840887 RepID=A0A9D1G9G2_9FIRM|nr:helix-turn-helix transcriptional regulator [Candidatus Onthousia faecipullorum]
MSQSEVARLVNITSPMYNYIESGKRRPKPELAKKIADILNFSWTRFYE